MPLTAQERRKKVTDRRNESGLQEFKAYLNAKTIKKLKEITFKTGYKKNINNEDLSKIIEYLIRQYDADHNQLIGKRKSTQYLIFISEVIDHQQKIGASNKQIIQFLERYYSLPTIFHKQSEIWNISHIEKISNKKWLLFKINQIEQKHEEKRLRRQRHYTK